MVVKQRLSSGLKRVLWLVVNVSAAVQFLCTASAQLAGYVPDRLLVRAKPGAAQAELDAALNAEGARQLRSIDQIGLRILQVPAGRLGAVRAALIRNPNIELVEPDFIVPPAFTPSDPGFDYQWHLVKMQTPTAWDVTAGRPDVVIAVLDTGVESTHPDLQAKLVPGWNTYDDNATTSDVHGHGTSVAGTAAACANNGIGVASVAPNCMIMPVRISDPNGWGYDSTVSEGLVWAADHGARVANISYAFSDSPVVKTAADYFRSKGGVVAMAAGNEGLRLTFADNPSVLTVSAIGSDDVVPSWSNRGLPIDFSAPGNGIYSTVSGGQYNVVSGTSFSAPCVAGVAALVISVNPNLRAMEIESILKSAVDDLGTPGWDELYGYGLINAQKAVNLALTQELPPTTDTIPPAVSITSPAAGTQLGRKVTVKVVATDNVGVTKVELLADARIIGTSAQASPSFSWNTSKLAKGTHTLQARAYDAAGNIANSSVVTVTK